MQLGQGVDVVSQMLPENDPSIKKIRPGAMLDLGHISIVFKTRICKNNICSPKGSVILTFWGRQTAEDEPLYRRVL